MFRSDEQSLATMRLALGITWTVTVMSNASAWIRQQVWVVLSGVFSIDVKIAVVLPECWRMACSPLCLCLAYTYWIWCSSVRFADC
jgi:hypothetical protein